MELNIYLQTTEPDSETNPLEWWKQHEVNFPLVAMLAKKYLCIPTTSSPSERAFSASGNIVTNYKKNTYSHNPHPNSALTPAEEEALLSFIFWMADHGFPITRSLVKVLAIGIIRESGRSNTTRVNLEKGPSDMWWSRFKARHPALTMRTADSLDRARVHGATPEAIEGFFSIYEALYIQHDLKNKPHLIFNCDETGFGDKPRVPREGLVPDREKAHLPAAADHAATHHGPLLPYKLDGPPNALYGIQQKGYMDGELFLKWLHHFIRYAPEERPIILIMNQHETHVSKEVIVLCRDNKIEILCLPAHTTHILQPLDIAVFNPLKTAFSKMASRMGLVRGDLVVGKKQFSPLLKHVYPTAVTAENVKAGFRKAGIFPLSREAVDTAQHSHHCLSHAIQCFHYQRLSQCSTYWDKYVCHSLRHSSTLPHLQEGDSKKLPGGSWDNSGVTCQRPHEPCLGEAGQGVAFLSQPV
ncbi:hypothetical protein SKAU_G00410570 [Synaphobranchus kaupii]|uniref:HTH CENPB-type domain-containing protein n=1 Tax=Synaphobranchus kaupii TaxID=118154 RepID=A0A9Q1E7P0_SYNKA|nr:hypothetical protein SKAU_G00410570 [Synaphobranchus kaupii]